MQTMLGVVLDEFRETLEVHPQLQSAEAQRYMERRMSEKLNECLLNLIKEAKSWKDNVQKQEAQTAVETLAEHKASSDLKKKKQEEERENQKCVGQGNTSHYNLITLESNVDWSECRNTVNPNPNPIFFQQDIRFAEPDTEVLHRNRENRACERTKLDRTGHNLGNKLVSARQVYELNKSSFAQNKQGFAHSSIVLG
jgi:hypothetical protein